MFRSAKAGDKVYSEEYGWGKISSICTSNFTTYTMVYPICVDFKDKKETFTIDGKISPMVEYQSLFWDEVETKAPEKQLPDLEVDTKF